MNANSYSSPGSAGGNKELILDILTVLEPEATPVTSAITKGEKPGSTFIEVLADTLRAPRISGTREGQDAGKANNKAKNRNRFGNYVHRLQDEYGVTDVQQAVSKAGGVAAVDDEYGRSKAKCLQECKRDIEAVICSGSEMQGGSDTDMQTRGMFTWIQNTAQATNPVPVSFRPPAAAVAAASMAADTTGSTLMSGVSGVDVMTEPGFNTVLKNLQKIYGSKQEYMMVAGDNIVQTVDNFTRVNSSTTHVRYQVTEMASEHTITLSVSVFDSSFGRASIVPTQFNNVSATTGLGDPNVAYLLNMKYWQLLFLEPLHSVDQNENAGGMNGYVKAMFALLCTMPKSAGKIYNA